MSASQRPVRVAIATVMCTSMVVCVLISAGCHDGPLYGLKVANPYYSLKQWRDDEAIGVTDHQRLGQLRQLARSIGGMSDKKQAMWSDHLRGLYENDPSPEMRRLTMVAAGRLSDANTALGLIDRGLTDSVAKVRMEACRALGRQPTDDATRMLVAAINTDTDIDVRQSAIAALGGHPGSIATGSLRRVLEDQDPATRLVAIAALREVTGRDHGDDPSSWIAALDDQPAGDGQARVAALPK